MEMMLEIGTRAGIELPRHLSDAPPGAAGVPAGLPQDFLVIVDESQCVASPGTRHV
jgi:excinuclease UvrABC helicase subunit UvrB